MYIITEGISNKGLIVPNSVLVHVYIETSYIITEGISNKGLLVPSSVLVHVYIETSYIITKGISNKRLLVPSSVLVHVYIETSYIITEVICNLLVSPINMQPTAILLIATSSPFFLFLQNTMHKCTTTTSRYR